MIFVDRTAYPVPSELLKYHRKQLEDLLQTYALPENERSQRQPDMHWPTRIRRELLDALIQMFHGKCAFCEQHASTIEHFRPRWRAGRLDGSVDVDRYWWLANDWNNLYLCCQECNIRKANIFPISEKPAPPLTFADDLLREKPLLLDPCADNPELHLQFHDDGTVDALSDRGVATIKVLQLNRVGLIMSRQETARWTTEMCIKFSSGYRFLPDDLDDFDAFLREIQNVTSQHTPHLAVVKAVATRFAEKMSGKSFNSAPPVAMTTDVSALPSVAWLQTIEIVNFKTITNLKLEFPVESESDRLKGQPWLMVLGENSVGKSSLLQAVALALMPDIERSRRGRADRYLTKRKGSVAGLVQLTFTDGSQRKLSFAKGEKAFHVEGVAPAFPVLAYGSTRLLPGAGSRKPESPSSVSVRNLFDQTHPLVNAEGYLCDGSKISDDRFNLLATSLKSLLPVGNDAKIKRTQRHMKSSLGGEEMPLSELSGGYKSVLALAMDIMFHLSNSSFDMETAEGLVMLDELELHLHPRWKIRVVEQLRTLFPRVRFIASTHDPLCVHGLRKGELHVMARHPTDNEFLIEQIDVPLGTRADEVLTGPWFGLPSTMDAETLELIAEHSALLQRTERTEQQDKRMDELGNNLRNRMGTFGNTRAQRAALAAAAALDVGLPQQQSDLLIRHRLNEVLSGAQGPAEGDDRA